MSKFNDTIRRRVSANGKVAKSLSVLYVAWLCVVLFATVNMYAASGHSTVSSTANWSILILSIVSSLIPEFISVLHDGAYNVVVNKKRSLALLRKLDERDLELRRLVFEKSYVLLASVLSTLTFLSPIFLAGGLTQDGSFVVAFNVLVLFTGLPSIVATWDKRAARSAHEEA